MFLWRQLAAIELRNSFLALNGISPLGQFPALSFAISPTKEILQCINFFGSMQSHDDC
jgi:hypothetical protein